MQSNIALYPQLEKKTLSELRCNIDSFQISYDKNGIDTDLKCEIEKVADTIYYTVIDDTGKWSPDKYNCKISGSLIIHEPELLFGENGLIDEDGILGVGLLWKSKTSNMRGSGRIGTFDGNSHDELIFHFEKIFPESSVRGIVELSFQLFIIKPGLRNTKLLSGLSLGDLYTITLVLEGINSTFTVYEKSAPGDVLWYVDCDWSDPDHDPFSETVKVTINTAHPAWIYNSEDESRRELLKEIMASSMQTVISELRSQNMELNGGDSEPGSVTSAIAYLIGRAQLDMSSDASIAKSLRVYLDKSMK